jgi:hypothetical protein
MPEAEFDDEAIEVPLDSSYVDLYLALRQVKNQIRILSPVLKKLDEKRKEIEGQLLARYGADDDAPRDAKLLITHEGQPVLRVAMWTDRRVSTAELRALYPEIYQHVLKTSQGARATLL